VNQSHISKIWDQFLEKIKSDWTQKYADFGTIDNIKGQVKLCEAIRTDILEQQGGNVLGAPSKEALNIYFNQRGLGSKPKQKTLEMFVDYLGYASIQDFYDQNQATNTPKEALAEDKQSSTFNLKYLFAIPVLLIPVLAYLYYTQDNYRDLQEQHFESMIQEVNDLEFSLYKAIPDLEDTTLLYDYYDKKYRGHLIERLVGLRDKGYVLDQELSAFKLTAKPDYINLSNTSAKVGTAEYWKIIWRKDGDIIHKYDHVNKQLYAFEKVDNRWLIIENQYEGVAQVKEEKMASGQTEVKE